MYLVTNPRRDNPTLGRIYIFILTLGDDTRAATIRTIKICYSIYINFSIHIAYTIGIKQEF